MTTKARTPARRLTARGAATRARILDAAASLVYERGFAGTSLDDVMAATGTSKSQLYHYFDGKDALIREVIKASSAGSSPRNRRQACTRSPRGRACSGGAVTSWPPPGRRTAPGAARSARS